MADTHMLNSPEQIAAWERIRAKFKDAGWSVSDSANFRLMFGWGYRAGLAELEEQNRQLVLALREATEAPAFDPEGSRGRLIAASSRLLEALKLAEDVLSHRPWSAEIWPDGTHPMNGITIIRQALADATGEPCGHCAPQGAQ